MLKSQQINPDGSGSNGLRQFCPDSSGSSLSNRDLFVFCDLFFDFCQKMQYLPHSTGNTTDKHTNPFQLRASCFPAY